MNHGALWIKVIGDLSNDTRGVLADGHLAVQSSCLLMTFVIDGTVLPVCISLEMFFKGTNIEMHVLLTL